MRIKTLKRNTSNVIRKAMEARQTKVSQINLNLNVLIRQKKDMEREVRSPVGSLGSALLSHHPSHESHLFPYLFLPCCTFDPSAPPLLATPLSPSPTPPSSSRADSFYPSGHRQIHGRLLALSHSNVQNTSNSETAAELEMLHRKQRVLIEGIDLKTREIDRVEEMASDFTKTLCETSQMSISRLMVELDTGGNIRLEDGKPNDIW